MEYIAYGLVYFLEITKFYLVYRHILCLKQRRGIQQYILAITGIVTLTMSEIVFEDKYKVIVYIIILIAISFIMNEEKILRMSVISVWTIFVISMLDSITSAVIGVIWNYEDTIINKAITSMICSVVTIIFLLIVSIKYKMKLLLNKIGIIYYILFSAIIMANALIISM